jgi:hypothetical protein
MVEGKAGVPIGESTVFSRPVQKPAHINAFTI